jgi:ferrous iron transport protein A
MPTLSELRSGQCGRITDIQGADVVSQRLMEMGLLEEETVQVVGFAPLGDPMEIRIRDYSLSLRKSEAARVVVTLLSS